MNEIRFDSILPKEIPVTLGDKSYTLKAASAKTTNKFRSALSSCTKVEGDKIMVTDAARAVEANLNLVSECLFDSEGKYVPIDTIRGWPNPIVESIIRGSIELCEFSKESEEDLKNS